MGAFFRVMITKLEFKNPLSTSTSQIATMMKWKTDVRTLQFLIFVYIFLLKLDPLWNHFVTQNIMINIFYPPRYLKRQIDVLYDKMGMDVVPYQ